MYTIRQSRELPTWMNARISQCLGLAAVLWSGWAWAAPETYWVTQDGSGAMDGSSLADSWAVAVLNNPSQWSSSDTPDKVDPGDTVVLSGEITSQLVIYGSGTSGNPITIDGDDGSSPPAVLRVYPGPPNNVCIRMADKEYIVVRDLVIEGGRTNLAVENRSGIKILNSAHITVDGCQIGETGIGVDINGTSHHIQVVRSVIHDQPSSGVRLSTWQTGSFPQYVTIGGDAASGNIFRDCAGYAGDRDVDADVWGAGEASDVVISYNQMFASSPDNERGFSGVYANGVGNLLVEYNTIHGHNTQNHRGGIIVKADHMMSSDNVIVRFNHIYDQLALRSYSGGVGISISMDWSNVYVYGNYVHDCANGINFNKGWQDENNDNGLNPTAGHAWANVIHRVDGTGIMVGGSGTDTMDTVWLFNNTIYDTATRDDPTWRAAGLYVGLESSGLRDGHVANNVVVDSRLVQEESYLFAAFSANEELGLVGNQWYQSNGAAPAAYLYGSGDCTPCICESPASQYFEADDVGDPGLRDPSGGDFTLMASSSCAGTGEPLALAPRTMTIHEREIVLDPASALDPGRTDWSRHPPEVVMAPQSPTGGWDKGAYVHESPSQPQADGGTGGAAGQQDGGIAGSSAGGAAGAAGEAGRADTAPHASTGAEDAGCGCSAVPRHRHHYLAVLITIGLGWMARRQRRRSSRLSGEERRSLRGRASFLGRARNVPDRVHLF